MPRSTSPSALERIGGPSAGLMFTLGIIDKLTDGDLTDGRFIAGTGTIDGDGKVGPIGGVLLKLITARDAGATVFLVPADNCAEAITQVPDGLQLVKVATVTDAMTALQTLKDGGTPRLLSAGWSTCGRTSEQVPTGQPLSLRRSAAGPRAGSAPGRRRAAGRRRARRAPEQAGTARGVPQHTCGQPGLGPVRVAGRLFGRRLRVRGQRCSCASGGSTTISCTSTQPATSGGQEICASAVGQLALGQRLLGDRREPGRRRASRPVRAAPPADRRCPPTRTAAAGRPSRLRRELLDLGHGDRQVGVLPPVRRAHPTIVARAAGARLRVGLHGRQVESRAGVVRRSACPAAHPHGEPTACAYS